MILNYDKKKEIIKYFSTKIYMILIKHIENITDWQKLHCNQPLQEYVNSVVPWIECMKKSFAYITAQTDQD